VASFFAQNTPPNVPFPIGSSNINSVVDGMIRRFAFGGEKSDGVEDVNDSCEVDTVEEGDTGGGRMYVKASILVTSIR
jgi:hypothetical protein